MDLPGGMTDWHLDRHGDDLLRELQGIRLRLAGDDLDPEVRRGLENTEEAILHQLKRLGRSKEARPAGRAKETR